MDAEKLVTIQHQIRQNQEEFNSYVKDLTSWADDMKTNENNSKTKAVDSAEIDLPPVRNSLMKKRKKKKVKSVDEQKRDDAKAKKKIGAYDYRAWDRFDADAAAEEVEDNEGRKEEDDDEYETDEEWEEQRRVLLAKEEKDKGNAHFKAGQWDLAIECYTTAIRLDPANSVLYTNRAMAQIRADRLGAAESDCTTALSLDPDNVKALFRRGIARKGIGKGHEAEALEDFEAVLKLEPGNKAARSEAENLEKVVRPTGEVKAISKDPSQRSKKPLRRLVIEEIGFGESRTAAMKKSEPVLEEFLKQRDTLPTKPSLKCSQTPASQASASSESATPASTTSPAPAATASTTSPAPATTALTASPAPAATASTAGPSPAGTASTTSPVPAGTASTTSPVPAAITSTDSVSVEKRSVAPKELSTPRNFNQFQSVFSSLKYRGDEDLNSYLLAIPPHQYPRLFGQCLEPRHVNAMVIAFASAESRPAADRLNALRRVPRFGFLAMMTSSKEREVVRKLRDRLLAASCITQGDFEQIGKDFRL